MTNRRTQPIAIPPTRGIVLWWVTLTLTTLGLTIWVLYSAHTVPQIVGAIAAVLVARHLANHTVDLIILRSEWFLAVMRLEHEDGDGDER